MLFRVFPRHTMRRFLILLVLLHLFLTFESKPSFPADIMSPGQPSVLVLFDFHREEDVNGTCFDFVPRSMEMVLGIKWIKSMIANNTESELGLYVHDVCGSVKRSVRIVNQYLNECGNLSTLAGVIVQSNAAVQGAVTAVLKPFGILCFHISDREHLSRIMDTSITMSTIPLWTLQASMDLLTELKFTSMVFISDDDQSFIYYMNVLKELADKYSICIEHSMIDDGNSLLSLTNKVMNTTPIFFISKNKDRGDVILKSLTSLTRMIFVIVDDVQQILNTSGEYPNLFIIGESFSPIPGLPYSIAMTHANFEVNDELTKRYFSNMKFCTYYDLTYNMKCAFDDTFHHFVRALKGRDVILVLSSFLNIAKSVQKATLLGCNEYDFNECQKALSIQTLALEQPENTTSLEIINVSSSLFIGEITDTEIYFQNNDTVKVAHWKNSLHITNVSLWSDIKRMIANTPCNTSACSKCEQCKQSSIKNYNIMYEAGDIYIHGLFPITQDSPSGTPCAAWSWEGIQMAEALKFSIDSINSRSSVLPYLKIGYIITDSCKTNRLDIDMFKACSLNMTVGESMKTIQINTGQIAATVTNTISESTPMLKAVRPTMVVSSLGIGINGPRYTRHLLAAASFLEHQNWTYVNLILSKNQDTIFSTFTSMLQSKNICISSRIIIESNVTLLEESIKTISLKPRRSGLFIFLSSVNDTLNAVKEIKLRESAFIGLTFVVFSWNSDSINEPGTVLIRPKYIEKIELNNHFKSLSPLTSSSNHWLKAFHEDYFKCSFRTRTTMVFPRKCESSNTLFSNLNATPLVSFITEAVETVSWALQAIFSARCQGSTGICAAFGQHEQLTSSIHSALLNLQQIGRELKMFAENGEFMMDLEFLNIHLDKNTTTFKSLGTYTSVFEPSGNTITHQYGNASSTYHQCIDWCPECFSCNATTTNSPEGVLYMEGEFIVGGFFPLHTPGEMMQTCGELVLDKEMEQIVEAFLFAIATSKTRYPYLLPNVSLGALALDTCSDSLNALQTLLNFETCKTTVNKQLHPQMVTSYVDANEGMSAVTIGSQRVQKLAFSIVGDMQENNNDILYQSYSAYSLEGLQALVQSFVHLNWTIVDVLRSSGAHQDAKLKDFLDTSSRYNICISHSIDIKNTTFSKVFEILVTSISNIVVVIAEEDDIARFVASIVSRPLPSKTYVFSEVSSLWKDISNINLPLGSLLVDRESKVNKDFENYYSLARSMKRSKFGNLWLEPILTKRENCNDGTSTCDIPKNTMYTSSRVVLVVDFILHALHNRFIKHCPDELGMCPSFAKVGPSITVDDLQNVSFVYQKDTLMKYHKRMDDLSGTVTLKNFQKNGGLVKVGQLSNGVFTFDTNRVQLYDFNGNKRSMVVSKCYIDCKCLGETPSDDENILDKVVDPYAYIEPVYFDKMGEFSSELWSLIVVAVAAGGSFVALMFIFYVIYKVCAGLLIKRYIGLGIFLLLSIMCLYMSVLPFGFNPSSEVCAARMFIPGLSYTLCFAALITKLMTLRSYKYIGLGGEISNLNQLLTVVFITAVQVAIGVQHIVLKDKLHVTRAERGNVILHACFYDRKELLVMYIYVICLIVVCALYSISVRRETKNMGEAKLILVCSWMCVPVWAAWLAVMMIQPRDFVEPTICVGILTTASLFILVVFVPKLQRIARLKYDIKKSGLENGGYKVDSDFMFERPYTLPAASRTSFVKYSDRTNPKSIASFDTNMSY